MQMEVFRILENFFREADGIKTSVPLRVGAIVLYYISEIVLIICLCHSIKTVLSELKKHNSKIYAESSANMSYSSLF